MGAVVYEKLVDFQTSLSTMGRTVRLTNYVLAAFGSVDAYSYVVA